MNGLVVLAACACVASGQFLAPGPAPGASHQFHAQDEFGQFSFGHAGGPSARTEARNAYGVTTGSYQYIDANGILQTANYIADPINGFRVSATNLPVAPGVPALPAAAAPLVAPVFDLPLPVAVQDTAEVAEAKAAFAVAYAAAEAAAAAAPAEERKKREAEEVKAAVPIVPFPYAGLPYAAGVYGPAGVYAAAPADIVAKINTAAPVTAPFAAGYPYAGLPFAGAGLPLAGLPYAGLPAGLPYAGLPVAAAAAVPAAPAREAVLTTIKANPGHAIVYTVTK